MSFLLPIYGSAQVAARLSYQLSTPKSLPLVFAELEESFDLKFSYAQNIVSNIEIKACQIQANSLEEFLSELLLQQGLEFRIVKNQEILVRPQLVDRETQQTPLLYEVSGRIIDRDSKAPLADVAVYLDTLNIGIVTELDGRYRFNIPASCQNRDLFFQLIGFETQRIPVVQTELSTSIQMQASSIQLDPVTITEKVPELTNISPNNAIRIQPFSSQMISSIVGQDLFRTIQLLPGISAHDELSTSLKIRGSSGDETLIVVDGIPIYKAEHFFGVFSAINSNYIESTTLFKNTLPIAYGGKTGGMLLMESNEQMYNRMSVQADLNLLTSSLVLKTPITDQLALILSGRTTYQDAASNPIFDAFENNLSLATDAGVSGFTRPDLIETVPSFQFFDLNAKLKWQISPKSKLDLNFFHSNDDLINEYENTFQVRVAANRTAENGEFFSNSEQWENIGSSLNYQLELPKKWQLSSSFYFTQYQNNGLIESSLTRDFRDREIELFSFQNDQYNRITDVGWRNQFDKLLANNRSLTLGAEFIQHDNEFRLREEDRTTFGGISQTYELAVFGSLPIINTSDFHLDLGNRTTYYGRTDQLYWSPRLNFYYRLQPNWALKGSAAHSNQFVREIVHENRLGQTMDFFLLANNYEYPVGTSNQFMIGTNWQLGNFNLDVECYHKDHQGLIEHSRLFAGFDRTEVNPGQQRIYRVFNGTGTTQGMDLLLKYEKRAYQAWLSYTLSKTEHQFKGIYRNEAFPSEDDRRHQFSWVNNYTLGKFNLSANYIFASGRPFSNLSILEQPSDVKDLDPTMFFDRLPNYSRLDLGLSYNFNWNWADCSFGLSMFNVTNHANVKYQQFIYSIAFLQNSRDGTIAKEANKIIGSTTRMLDRTLNLNFNVRF